MVNLPGVFMFYPYISLKLSQMMFTMQFITTAIIISTFLFP
jgi:hypothetical protein